jgi:hypothetical protein
MPASLLGCGFLKYNVNAVQSRNEAVAGHGFILHAAANAESRLE